MAITDVIKYFGKNGKGLAEWKETEWDRLTPDDKKQLEEGIINGTLTY